MTRSRRHFITSTAAFTAASAGRVQGAQDRIHIGAIGTGNRGRYLLQSLSKLDGNELVHVCDVYEPRREQIIQTLSPQARSASDYKRVLDDATVNAVVIASPDHWHVPMTVDALEAGKDVYVEKPVTHTVEEGDTLHQAVASTRCVVQTGTQQRSWPHFRRAVGLVQSGGLGRVLLINTYWYQNYAMSAPFAPVEVTKLDWKQWLGPAPQQLFEARKFYRWRWFWDFGGGAFTDLYTHWVDVAHWALGKEQPATTMAAGASNILKDLQCPDTVTLSADYDGVLVNYTGMMAGSREDGGLVLRGTNALMKLHRLGYTVYPEAERSGPGPLPAPSEEVQSQQDGTIDHLQNWLDCMRSRKTPNAPVSVGIAAARAGHWGNAALRKGQSLCPSLSA